MILVARDRLRDAITTISGVGDTRMGGYVAPNMRIWLNPTAMRDKEIAVEDVISAVKSQHLLAPSGYMDNGPKETNVRVVSELATAKDFGNLIIPNRRGETIWTPLS
jgi:multidrug efflux pump subunit AcrB